MDDKRTIVLVLRSGGDFSFQDVEIITHHITDKWTSPVPPRIVLLWDNASCEYNLGNLEIIPLVNKEPKTWSRIALYAPEMEKYRPFLYMDLDTAVIQSVEKLFDLVTDESKFITLEDLWQPGRLATGLMWVPANSEKINKIWISYNNTRRGSRMDNYIRSVVKQDLFWQSLTTTIYDFKPQSRKLLKELPQDATIVCFHGQPRIPQAFDIEWVKQYADLSYYADMAVNKLVTVIIPYDKDRGYLKEAIASVPDGVQLILSQGDGNWPENFNKALPQATGKYIKYLHEDDRLTPNCIRDSVRAMEDQGADFIHGNAMEVFQHSGHRIAYKPKVQFPTLEHMLVKNYLHSATLMYRREIFDRIGGFDESLNTAEEYEFSLRCLVNGFKIGYCPKYLAVYRRHEKQKVRVVSVSERKKESNSVKHKYNKLVNV